MQGIRFFHFLKVTVWLWTALLVCDSTLAIALDQEIFSVVPVPQATNRGDSWWLARHEQLCERLRTSHADVLMIGDSIMQGWEDEGRTIWQQYYGQRNAANLGFSSDRTEHLLWRLHHGEIDTVTPKLAVVLIGTNNIAAGQSAQHTALGIKAIVMSIRERLPDTTVLLLAIFPRAFSPHDEFRQSIRLANGLIAKYADGEHVFYLDLAENFLDETGYLSKELMPDLLHPSAQGYKVWAESMEGTIRKLLDR